MTAGAPGSARIWGGVPSRNRNFTGREDLLDDMRSGAAQVTLLLPAPGAAAASGPVALRGLGGVGKTQVAIEYAHRHREDFDLVWWIPAEQEGLIPAALARLAPELGLGAAGAVAAEDAAREVLRALSSGVPVANWLLVFDNATEPLKVLEWVPDGPGQVVITSQNLEWREDVRTLGVDVFTKEESADFLGRRIPGVDPDEADQLAEALGHLPIVLDQASALHHASGLPLDEYLALLERRTSELLDQGRHPDTAAVSASWDVAMSELRRAQPTALEVLRVVAHFGPAPIPRAVLTGGTDALDPGLREILSDPIKFHRAVRELGRFSLLKVDPRRRTFELHRVLQRWLRENVSPQESERLRNAAHLLLAAADPRDPDDATTWPAYLRLAAHVEPSGAVDSGDGRVRFLLRSVVRFLYQSGNIGAALRLAERCATAWTADPESDMTDVLAMRRHLGSAQRRASRFADAFATDEAALETARERGVPDDHTEVLRLTNNYIIDLRSAGRFTDALNLSRSSVDGHVKAFGATGYLTLTARTNYAVGLVLSSHYAEAVELLTDIHATLAEREGASNALLSIVRANQIRAIRLGGDFELAQFMGEELLAAQEAAFGPDHAFTLRCTKDLAIAMRLAEGGSPESVEFAADVLDRMRRRHGDVHPDTVAASLLLANTARVAGDLPQATRLTHSALDAYARMYSADHPYTHMTASNLALLHRLSGDAAAAHALDREAHAALTASLGEDHQFTLIAAQCLAGDLAALGRFREAADLGRATHRRVLALLGEENPMTFVTMANLALDLIALGGADAEEGAVLREWAVAWLVERLGDDSPWAPLLDAGRRIEYDFDPMPL
ncbi:FxSxx-COOH system tetratricopeptide repeat protein [Actinomadura flavalba]|uniref:FxSxx-COOH system tetratricopeptide repeat protein n=1 Tax=Actinomadura flavalba TaxID=1120938 RepID=UPI00036B87B9|nr:FxSxx-COOH system tetratricopeptide repeat protein [Actinomadura flavalba]